MLPLLLAACGYATYYPSTSYEPSDTSPPTMPCGAVWAFEAVELRAVSTAGIPLELYEVEESCAETYIGPLRSDEVLSVGALPGEVYAARDEDGGLYAWTQIPYGEPMFAWEVR